MPDRSDESVADASGRPGPAPSSGPMEPQSSQPPQSRLGGFFKSVDYASSRDRYRPPPDLYGRLSRLIGPAITSLGLSPRDVVTLEVRGRRSGVTRRTIMVRVVCDDGYYVVSLAGESEWVRNVRAGGGQVMIGRRRLHAARLTELPPQQRAPVIRAYLRRWGRRPSSKAMASEARNYFGVSPDASLAEIQRVAEYYPVFRINYEGHPDTRRGWGK